MYERPGPAGAWSFVRTLTDFTVSDDRGGSFLALDAAQNVVMVSASGRASVFERTASGWTETPLPPQASDFGADGAITPAYAVVSGTFNGRLAAFVYKRAALGQWPFETRILADPQPISDNDYLGEGIDASGDHILIEAPADEFDPDGVGRLIVFSRGADGQWREEDSMQDIFVPQGPRSNAPLSVLSVAPSTRTRGAYRNQGGGATFFLEDEPESWVAVEDVRSPDALMNRILISGVQRFRFDNGPVVLNASPAPVGLASGTPGDEDRGFMSGSVTVFAPQVGFEAFKPVVKFLASDARSELGLGGALDFHGNTLAATGGNRLYVFDIPSDLTQPAILQDDFEDGNSVGWRQSSSAWIVTSSRGSRVYRQSSTTGEHFSTRGDVDWTNVALEADVRPLAFNGSDRWVSLMARFLDSTHYYSVTLRNTNTLRLSRRVGGTFTTLASRSLQVTPGRSYRVRLEAIGTWLRVYVNNQLMLQARDSTHTHGSAGFRTSFAQGEFDNVVISPNPSVTLLSDNFESNVFDWAIQPAANWIVTGAAGSRVLRQTVASGNAQAISGIRNLGAVWPEAADQVVQARLRALSFSSGSDPRFGLIARYRNGETNDPSYTLVTLHRNGYLLLRELKDGVLRVIDRVDRTISAGTWYTVRLEAVGDRVRVYLNNALVLEGGVGQIDPNSVGVQFGLITAGTSAEFDNVRVTQP